MGEKKVLTEALGKAKAHIESSELKITEFKIVDNENKTLDKKLGAVSVSEIKNK